MRKVPVNELRKMLKKLLSFLSVVGIDYEKLISAINNLRFDDIEDCLQSVCAVNCGTEYIITRNLEDFKSSEIAAFLRTSLFPIISCKILKARESGLSQYTGKTQTDF